MSERIYFGSIKETIEPPTLIEVQLNSYVDFLQKDVPFSKRKNQGLQAVFKEVFPIESYDEKAVLDFSHYEIGEPKLTALEAQREGQTYSAPLHVTFQLREEKGTKEEKVYMGEIPLMTPQGTFVINGAERVVVSQLHRSPGIAFESTVHLNGKVLYSFRIIPDRGSWIEVQFDTADLLYIYLDRRKRRRKFLATTFLRPRLRFRRRRHQTVLQHRDAEAERQTRRRKVGQQSAHGRDPRRRRDGRARLRATHSGNPSPDHGAQN